MTASCKHSSLYVMQNKVTLKMKKNITWKFISNFEKNKFVRNTYIYLILLPFIISILEKYNLTFVIDAIPFSWRVLYFSALFFTLGNIVYYFYAPSIIKENENFNDFEIAKKNFNHIHQYADEMKLPFDDYDKKLDEFMSKNQIQDRRDVDVKEFIKDLKGKEKKTYAFIHEYSLARITTIYPSYFSDSYSDKNSYNNYLRYKDDLDKTEEANLSICFWNLHKYANTYNYNALIICVVLFGLATLLFVCVAINSVLIDTASYLF